MSEEDIKRAMAHLEEEIRQVKHRLDQAIAGGDAQHRTVMEDVRKLQVLLDGLNKEVSEVPRVAEIVLRIKNALSGPEDGSADGFFAKVRRLREEMDAMVLKQTALRTDHDKVATAANAALISRESEEWKTLVATVKELENTRQRTIGMVTAGSTIGGLIGFGLSVLLK